MITTASTGKPSRTSRFGWPFFRRNRLPKGQESDEGTSEEGNERAATASSDRPPQSSANGQLSVAFGSPEGRSADPVDRPDWDGRPPTEHQRRNIRVLGGNPADVRTKQEASDLIDRLRRLQGPSPLDPYKLEKRGKEAGGEAGSDWKSAHDSLLAGLRLDLQQYINATLDSLRSMLSESCGSKGGRLFQPQRLVREAEVQLERLRVWRRSGLQAGVPMPEIRPPPPEGVTQGVSGGGGSVSERGDPEESAVPTAREGPSGWWLIATCSVIVILESLLNVSLLMNALETGILGAILLAFLVSGINVGGLGIGGGLLFSLLRRQPWAKGLVQGAFFSGWLVVAMGFSLIAGRHREAYSRIVEAVRLDPTGARPSPQELMPGIAFNPLTWDFQALLFALLGLILCAVGFAKGFTFIKAGKPGAADANRTDANTLGDGDTLGQNGRAGAGSNRHAGTDRHIVTAYEEVLNQFQVGVSALRSEAAEWYGTLNQKSRDIHHTVSMIADEKNRQACMDCVTHAFIREYNNENVEKIELTTVEEYRQQKYSEPLLVTPSDAGTLEEADALAAEWRESGQEDLERRITEAQEEMMALWIRYWPLILGSGQVQEIDKGGVKGVYAR